MLSRVADSLYWLSLNMERADNITKLLSVRLVSILEDNPKIGTDDNWEELVKISADVDEFHRKYSVCNRSSVIDFLAFSKDNPNSISSCIAVARENAKGIREIIPMELWEVLNDLYLKIKAFPSSEEVTIEQLNDFFQMILEKSFQFQGIITGLMPRGESYSFIMFGKHLERLRKLSRTLDVYYHKKIHARDNKDSVNYHYWSAVLSTVGGYESYLQKYQAFIEPLKVVNYLIFDETLPRSANFNVKRLLYAFGKLEAEAENSYSNRLRTKLDELMNEVKYQSLDEVTISLHDYFQQLQQLCDDVGLAIMETYYLGEIKLL